MPSMKSGFFVDGCVIFDMPSMKTGFFVDRCVIFVDEIVFLQ